MAYITAAISWLPQKEDWMTLTCIGAIKTAFESKKGKSLEWHDYISSRKLSANERLHHARIEWAVERMHWLLDVHFDEKAVEQKTKMYRKT